MSTISSGDRNLTSAELKDRIARAAGGFLALGLQPNDSIAMLVRNDFTFLEVGQAATVIGARPVAMNWHATVPEARYILEDCEAKVLVIHADLLHRLADAVPAGVKVLAVPTPPELMDAFDVSPEDAAPPAGVTDWNTWRDSFEPHAGDATPTPSTVIYTSGTTGKPKGVIRRKRSAAEQVALREMLGRCFGFLDVDPPSVVTAVIGPIYHSAPNAHSNYSYAMGASVIIMPRFTPEGLLKMIETHKITHLNMVPIMFARLLKLPQEVRARYDLSSLRYVGHAAAPCPPEIKRQMIEWWGPVINEYYGSTEMGNVTHCTSEQALAHPGTVGKPMPGAIVRVVDAEGNDMPPMGIGEIIGRASGTADFDYKGYDPAARQGMKFGLIASGDVGYFNEDGFLFICDRNSDMIISGGVNIYPAEIEAALHQMPGIEDCAVFGIPNEEFGESVCAVIQMQPGQPQDAAAVQAFLREHVAGYKIPRTVAFTDNMPREDSGKVFKRKLREPYWANAGRSI